MTTFLQAFASLMMACSLLILLAGFIRQRNIARKTAAWVRAQPPAPGREWLVCPECEGREQVPTGEIERGTGYALTMACPVCSGEGAVLVQTEEDEMERARR